MSEETSKIEKKPFEIRSHKRWEHPKVTVIVPVYKVDKYLTQCLNSVVNQTMEELEIIIIDEGDQDRCREIIDYFEAHDPRIVAPHRKNGGYGASCNLGFDMARGEYIAIVESDDYIEPEMYEEMYAYAKALDADVVKTPFTEYFSNGFKQDCCYRAKLRNELPQNMCFSMKENGGLLAVHASLWSGIYRTKYMHEKNIRFVEAKGGAYVDCGFRVDTLINTDKVAWLDKPYYNYRVDAEGSSSNTFKLAPMLKRWSEVHEKMHEEGLDEDYEKYYGGALILEEFYSALCKPWLMDNITDDEYKTMAYNLSFTKREIIENSSYLIDQQKRDILRLKEQPEKTRRNVKMERKLNALRWKIDPFLTKLSHPVLLFWMAVGSIVSGIMHMVLLRWPVTVPSGVLAVSRLFIILFLIGTAACFVGKILLKTMKILLKLWEKHKISRIFGSN